MRSNRLRHLVLVSLVSMGLMLSPLLVAGPGDPRVRADTASLQIKEISKDVPDPASKTSAGNLVPRKGAPSLIPVTSAPSPAPQTNAPSPVPGAALRFHHVFLPFVSSQEPLTPRLYQLEIDPIDLDWLYRNYRTYETVPAVFTYQGMRYDVEVRFRGGTARELPKKSWKIDFPGSQPFEGQRELNLNAEYTDKSLLREALSYDLFARAGMPASRFRFARLEVNGQYMGLFLQIEQVDQRFLDRIAWDPNGNLYKGNYGNFELSHDYLAYENSYAKKTNKEDSHNDVIDFVEMINYTPEEEFPATLAQVMDVGTYLDWVALHILLGDFEWLEKNYYIHHDLKQNRWTFLPWDLDLTLGHNWHWGDDRTLDTDITWDNPIDSGTIWSKKADGKWNKLVTEVLRNPDFRFAYCRRLWALMHDQFAAEEMFRRIDAFYAPIVPYAEADPHKWGTNAEFHAGPDELKTYVANRIAWLEEQFPTYCPEGGPLPVLNEMMSFNEHTQADEAGEYEPWLELYNPALVSVDVGGMQLEQALTGTLKLRWRLPEGTKIPPQGFVLVWLDGEPVEGPLHAGFRLADAGGTVALVDKAVHGGGELDRVAYEGLAADQAWGRTQDGGEGWEVLAMATPGGSNAGPPPQISETAHWPPEPQAGQGVTVTAVVSHPSTGEAVWLYWSAGQVPEEVPMVDDGAHGDGAAGDGRYGAALPGLAAGTVVSYYVVAQNDAGLITRDPARAPDVAHGYIVGFERPPLYLNELVAINQDTLDDEWGESDDWFEIYNAGGTAVDLGGMYLTDALEDSTQWELPAGLLVPAGGHLVLWADGQPEQGPAHVDFKLDGDGERLALYAGAAGYNGLVDEVYYGPQVVDRAWGRHPDGSAGWRGLEATPGAANRQPGPEIRMVRHWPERPGEGEVVGVTALIEDEGAVVSATLHYNYSSSASSASAAGFQAVALERLAGALYGGQIPSQTVGVAVAYYVEARDDLGAVTRFPRDAPAVTYGYQVSATLPAIVINEFLASNAVVIADETGAYEDWVELYNTGQEPVNAGGLYLTDDLGQPAKWRIPAGVMIPPGGYLLIWTDDDEPDGPLHAGFKLSKEGEEIGLFGGSAAAPIRIDSVRFGPQATDVSTGRQPDGGPTWTTYESPTPGASNSLP